MYATARIEDLEIDELAYFRQGLGPCQRFGKGRILSVDRSLHFIGIGDIKLLYSGHRAVPTRKFENFPLSQVLICGPTAELAIKAPFTLATRGYECFFTGLGLVCWQTGNRFKFSPETDCFWSRGTGIVIKQRDNQRFLDGRGDSISYILNDAGQIVYYNLEMEN